MKLEQNLFAVLNKMNKVKENGHNKEKVNAWSNKHQSCCSYWIRKGRRVRRVPWLLSMLCEQLDWWFCLMTWQVAGPSNCCVHNISISHHGKFPLKRLHPSHGFGIRTGKSTMYTDRGL